MLQVYLSDGQSRLDVDQIRTHVRRRLHRALDRYGPEEMK